MALYLGTNEVALCGSYNASENPSDAVKFIDYDGTVLHTYSASDFLALNSLPSNPSHTDLVAQGWNWTLADAQAYVEQWGFLDIGQSYTTSSGKTEIDIKLLVGRTAPYLKIAVNGSISVDWGDGSTASTITGSSWTSAIATQHTYSSAGNYTIKITINNGGWSFYPGTTNYGIINSNNSTAGVNYVYTSAVTAIRIGSGDIRFGHGACSYMYNLQYITLPTTVTMYNIYSVFVNCYNLKAVIFPLTSGNITFNSASTFGGCYNLKYICFSNKMTSMYYLTFDSCYNLKELYLPNECVVTSGGSTIPETLSLTLLRVIIPYRNIKHILIPQNDVNNILENLTTITNSQFAGNHLITTVTIPDNITSIQSYAFAYNYGLQSVTLPNITSILSYGSIFEYCRSLTTINIPSNLTALGNSTFSYCNALQGPITISGTFTSLETYTFNYNYALQSLTLPNTITSFSSYAINNCYNLENITLPSSLTTIGNYNFQYGYRLTNMTIPVGVTSIGNYAFQYCYGLKELHIKPTTPPTIGQYTFRNLPSDCTIYVPSASLSTYQTATYWSNFSSQMVGE